MERRNRIDKITEDIDKVLEEEQPRLEELGRFVLEGNLFDECFADLPSSDPDVIKETVEARLYELTTPDHADLLLRLWFHVE